MVISSSDEDGGREWKQTILYLATVTGPWTLCHPQRLRPAPPTPAQAAFTNSRQRNRQLYQLTIYYFLKK